MIDEWCQIIMVVLICVFVFYDKNNLKPFGLPPVCRLHNIAWVLWLMPGRVNMLSTFTQFLNCFSHHHHLLCRQLSLHKQDTKEFHPNSLCETSFTFCLVISSQHLSVIPLFPAIHSCVTLCSECVSFSVSFLLPSMVGCQPWQMCFH